MNLPAIDMRKSEARRHFRSYRAEVRQHQRAEDRMLMRGYQQLALGRQVVNAAEAISKAGMGPDGFPRLAICRADAHKCEVRYYPNGTVVYAMDDTGFWMRAQRSRRRHFETAPVLPGFQGTNRHGVALVPTVPPWARPHQGGLHRYFTLWEATWRPVAPKDPALLRWLGGDLYVVLAIWDLTELERAAIGLRG